MLELQKEFDTSEPRDGTHPVMIASLQDLQAANRENFPPNRKMSLRHCLRKGICGITGRL